jgi:hypothetical protein
MFVLDFMINVKLDLVCWIMNEKEKKRNIKLNLRPLDWVKVVGTSSPSILYLTPNDHIDDDIEWFFG